jgi:hypothetical protein
VSYVGVHKFSKLRCFDLLDISVLRGGTQIFQTVGATSEFLALEG